MSATRCAVPTCKDGRPEEVEAVMCFACKEVPTLRRCLTCRNCALCSDACVVRYRSMHYGNSGCIFHKVAAKYAPCIRDGSGIVKPFEEDAVLGEHRNAPVAIMCHAEPAALAEVALKHCLMQFLSLIKKQRCNAPITAHTLAVSSLVPDAEKSSWTQGYLRASWMPDPNPAVTAMVCSERDHYEKFAARMLVHASRLAVAQCCSIARRPPATANGQSFLIAGLVRLKNASGGTEGYGLQVDMIVTDKTLDCNLQFLSCERTLAEENNARVRAAMVVMKLKPGIHAESGMSIFEFPTSGREFYEPRLIKDLPPLCAWHVACQALSITNHSYSKDRTPTPPSA